MNSINYESALKIANFFVSAIVFLFAIKALRRRGFLLSELISAGGVRLTEVATVVVGLVIASTCSALAFLSVSPGLQTTPAGFLDSWYIFLLIGCIGAPIFEEFIFRGYLLSLCQEKFGTIAHSVGITSLVFALVHPWQSFVGIFILSVWLCSIRLRTKSLLMCIVAHAAMNGAIFLLDTYLPIDRILLCRHLLLTGALALSAVIFYSALTYKVRMIYKYILPDNRNCPASVNT